MALTHFILRFVLGSATQRINLVSNTAEVASATPSDIGYILLAVTNHQQANRKALD